MNVLEVKGLSRTYGGLQAVQDVDLCLPKGQVRALIGPNGAGKTTLVGLITGRVTPSAGRVRFLDRDVSGLPAYRRIAMGMGYTFQITSVFANLSLHENVALAVRRRGGTLAQVDHDVNAALSEVGLASRAGQLAGDLSYGHQRLLEIAMGLAQEPQLLILDEPTQGLSSGEVTAFKALIRRLAGQITVLLIEHNMDVVMGVADIITVLNFGAVLAEGTPAEIRANGQVQAAYLGGGDAGD
jgi:branched-chain amino acid transport system ATP-binding protein